jgi:dephospho-CoA kinase
VRVIAITGGIGSGKSNVTALYRSLGIPAIDADALSRALTAPGGDALPSIREAFGDGVFTPEGCLNRTALARLVFMEDPAALRRLNAIMHPMIARRVYAELERLRNAGAAVALLDAPLLFEAGLEKLADTVICVTAPEDVRIRRVRKRDGSTAEEALRRIRSQNPAERTEKLSDYVLSTDATREDTRARALELWQRVLRNGPMRPVG